MSVGAGFAFSRSVVRPMTARCSTGSNSYEPYQTSVRACNWASALSMRERIVLTHLLQLSVHHPHCRPRCARLRAHCR